MGEPARRRGKPTAAGPRQAAPGLSPELAGYLEDYLGKQRTPGTRRVHGQALREFVAGVADVAALARMDHRNVLEWRNALQRRGNTKVTINRKLSAVRGFLDFLVQLGVLVKNPAHPDLVEGFRVSDESKTRGLSAAEARKLLAACDDGTLAGFRDRAIILLGILGGLRRSEIAALTPSRIVRVPVDDGGGKPVDVLVLTDTKTTDYARQVLDPRAKEAIDEYLAALPRPLGAKDPLFFRLTRKGRQPARPRPLSPYAVNLIIQRRAAAAGVKGISAHSLRHACTTLALDGGAKLERVQAHLRHKDPRTTMRYYRNLKSLRNDAARRIRF